MSLSVFKYQSNSVRIVQKDGEPWFIAKDLCEILDIRNVSHALARLDDDEKRSLNYKEVVTLSDDPDTTRLLAVSESGMYALVLSSRKPDAKPFRKWVTSEVLPSIRKTGSYSLPQSRRDDLRLSSTEVRKETMAVLQAAGFNKTHHYINVTQMVYRGLFDMDAEQLRKDRGLADDANVRDHLTKQELGMIRTLELMVQQVLVSKVFTSSADLNRYVRTISQHMKSISGVDPKAFVQGGRD